MKCWEFQILLPYNPLQVNHDRILFIDFFYLPTLVFFSSYIFLHGHHFTTADVPLGTKGRKNPCFKSEKPATWYICQYV